MGFLDKILGPTPDYANSESARAAREALAKHDADRARYEACGYPNDGTYKRDTAAMDRKRAELLDNVAFAEQSGKYKQ
ncbi:hypothetical protein [Nocardiopsis tropica]|uniref:Uncharacterized protein n=1 Tax=Nocardiopsis tropica TaxID=109330 RepID=A0ABU7L378_9ACTN|nr:hypothetical protein [Nocardiopsis umidischolae]MEE2055709.1 hypothetical protein [Nocardiopsis umidischolae]